MSTSDPRPGEPDQPGDDLLLRSGKVDPEALRRAWEESSDDEALGRVRFEISRDLDTRLDKYLTSRITFMSRNQLQRIIDEGAATINGRTGKSGTRLHKGDVVEIEVPPPPSSEIRPQEIPLDILFEDSHLIVLNKHADIIVHPARSALAGTLINALAWHFQNVSGGRLSTVGNQFARPGVVHRLDRNTTGCIVFAKDDEAHWKLGAQFEHRKVDKRYLALVHGRVEPPVDVIDLPIGPHPSRVKGYREKYVVRHDQLGKASITIARVRERYIASRDSYSLLELELKTGRTHQIRVHLSHLNWPIVGDDMYGGLPLTNAAGEPIIARQALHAALLAFQHPITGESLRFVAPLPEDFRLAIEHLRAHQVEPVAAPGACELASLGL